MQNFKFDEKNEQEFSGFLQQFDIFLKDKIQNRVDKDITLYDVSETLYKLRKLLTCIAMENIILLMLLARACLKKYGFSLQHVILDEKVRVEFYEKSRLRTVLELYSEMFLKAPLENQQYKQSPEIKISNNLNKEAICCAKQEGPGLVTILGLQPHELNNEKKILDKKLKNMIKANHPDQINNSEIGEKEKKECDKKYKAANQMKKFLDNGVLTLYLDERMKQKNKKNIEDLEPKNPEFHEVLAIENSKFEKNTEVKKISDGINRRKPEVNTFVQKEKDVEHVEKEVEIVNPQPEKNPNQLKKEEKAVNDLISLCDNYIAHLDTEYQKNRREGNSMFKLAIVQEMRQCFKGNASNTDKLKNFKIKLSSNNKLALSVKRDTAFVRFLAAVGRIISSLTVIGLPLATKLGSFSFLKTHGEIFFDKAENITSKVNPN